MSLKIYNVYLTGDAVQPITVPNGAQFLKAVRWPGKYVEMHFLGDDHSDASTMVIEQVMNAVPDNPASVTQESVMYVGSAEGIWESRFTVTHLFEVLP
jgi:hypothetical protein